MKVHKHVYSSYDCYINYHPHIPAPKLCLLNLDKTLIGGKQFLLKTAAELGFSVNGPTKVLQIQPSSRLVGSCRSDVKAENRKRCVDYLMIRMEKPEFI